MATNNKSRLELRQRAVGPWPMNSYAVVCPATEQSVLIDPGAEPEALMEMLGDSRPSAILLTHTHPDHIGALEAIREQLSVPIMAYPEAASRVQVDVHRHLVEGDVVVIGEYVLEVYHTPGHTDDMLSFYFQDDTRAIVGDTIFAGGPGKTWSAEDFQTTLETLRDIVLEWPDDTICYPGHGPSFRLGDKRAAIEAFLQREHGDFYGDATWES